MVVPRKNLSCSRSLAWQVSFCLLLFAFLLRSLFAAGYMPAEPRAGSFPFAVALCSAGGLQLTELSHPDSSSPVGQDQLYESCPFGLVVAYKLIPGVSVLAPALDVYFHPWVAVNGLRLAPPSPALGPPLGPRAPPFGNLLTALA